MKIKKDQIQAIKTYSINNINLAKKFKFTKNETILAAKMAMRIRKRASKKWNCSFNEISLSMCMKEAYRRISIDKLNMSGILTKENKHSIKNYVFEEYGFNNVDSFIREKQKNIYSMIPSNVKQQIILNIAKMEMKTRQEFVF